ncbi:PREDICTED: general odorant-binding protein 56a-like [Vollenhovia emeryi]|uniref:general odorant-binding protein 56a-like n=1 Tax=Vollenhovia emeryi TaxID=411798 RepID=UPI0005F485E0|nr:PREDICTED: general odorant-binding protein 56a-like [Vollenhovia emeryi]
MNYTRMAREGLICICASLVLTQLLVVSAADPKTEDIDWTTVHDELRKLAATLRKKCIGETGATIEMLEGAEIGDFSSDSLPCYFKCVMEKGGVMKKDGKINFKVLSKLMPQAYRHIGMEMLDQCRSIEGSDKCNKALNFNKCMYTANPVAYFVI